LPSASRKFIGASSKRYSPFLGDIAVADEFCAVVGAVVWQEAVVVGLTEVIICVGDVALQGLAALPFHSFYYKGRERTVAEGEVCEEGVEGVSVDPVVDGGVDGPDGVTLNFQYCHMDEVQFTIARGICNGGTHGGGIAAVVVRRDAHKNKVAGM